LTSWQLHLCCDLGSNIFLIHVMRESATEIGQDPSECTIFPADFAANIDYGSIVLDDGISVADSPINSLEENDTKRVNIELFVDLIFEVIHR
jgi:hypothetical protein